MEEVTTEETEEAAVDTKPTKSRKKTTKVSEPEETGSWWTKVVRVVKREPRMAKRHVRRDRRIRNRESW